MGGDEPRRLCRRRQGLVIRWGWFDSPFGLALVMATERGICGLGFAEETGAEPTMADLRSRWPNADFVEDPTALGPMVEAAFGVTAARPCRWR
jgi:AraC family transcriptional regulator of adaptative response/methylated-DNA-[protein]-cysteine methyltransferase